MAGLIERRFTQRASVSRNESKISGLAAVFYSASDRGTQYQLWEDTFERIMPGAFDRALRELHDVRALFNHNPLYVLGRSTAGTLRLTITPEGLAYEIDAPDTATGRDVVTSIGRGDITGSSFAFVPTSVTWREDGNTYVREINDVDLYDVGPVTYPAYASSTTGLRAAGDGDLTDARNEFNAYIEKHAREAEYVNIRARVADISGTNFQ